MAPLTVLTVDTPSLGDRSYLVHDGEVAFAVDPQRDIDRVLALLEEHGVRLTDVFETHIHNDYVTGGLALARRTGAAYHVNAVDEVAFERTPVRDGDTVAVGDRMRVTAVATPGHTFTHLSYALADGSTDVGVFSGGSLLYGATGRPDLLGPEHTDALVRHQHASAHRLADLLPDDAEVFPTHGFGSFCSATQSEATASTIGQERQANPVLTQDEETYVRELLDGLGAWPAYYAHMAPANEAGPSEPDLSLPSARRRRRAPPPHRGRRVGGGPPPPDRLRRRPRPRHAQLRARRRVLDVRRLADRVGHPDHPARCRPPTTSRPPSASWSGSASTDRPRTRPAGPRTGATVRSRPSRPPRSPTSSRSAGTVRSSFSTSAAPRSTPPPASTAR